MGARDDDERSEVRKEIAAMVADIERAATADSAYRERMLRDRDRLLETIAALRAQLEVSRKENAELRDRVRIAEARSATTSPHATSPRADEATPPPPPPQLDDVAAQPDEEMPVGSVVLPKLGTPSNQVGLRPASDASSPRNPEQRSILGTHRRSTSFTTVAAPV
jgi:hypothetical protein